MRMQVSARSLVLVSILLVATACGGDGGGVEPAPLDGGGSGTSFLDEPLPTAEQLANASDCDELNRFLAGVENENFRVNADRTLAEEDAGAADEYENFFDVFYLAFSDRQGDLGCSDAEMMSVLETARDQRCAVWIADGHQSDEEPLLLNTASC